MEMNAGQLFVAVSYGILNRSNGEFHYARAGHELPLILAEDGQVSSPEMGLGMALGIFHKLVLDERSITILPGGCMLLCSDGAADTRNHDDVRFGKEGLKKSMQKFGTSNPSQLACQAIYDGLVDYQNGAPQYDDVTLLCVRRLDGK